MCLFFAAQILNSLAEPQSSMEPQLRNPDTERANKVWNNGDNWRMQKQTGTKSQIHKRYF
jgi:hypothetical protein